MEVAVAHEDELSVGGAAYEAVEDEPGGGIFGTRLGDARPQRRDRVGELESGRVLMVVVGGGGTRLGDARPRLGVGCGEVIDDGGADGGKEDVAGTEGGDVGDGRQEDFVVAGTEVGYHAAPSHGHDDFLATRDG